MHTSTTHHPPAAPLVPYVAAVHEMEEMLHALGPYAAGLNAARWDLKVGGAMCAAGSWAPVCHLVDPSSKAPPWFQNGNVAVYVG